ncbi:MAG: hypothetical protein F4060_12055 [Holophagales bacterium]|nr:hypothetical protein [Holophagales bacterium]MYG29017.1 hypothetical protein [Holophagales bacterium]MYI80663.1 hypothetical protein [Holophagales bacterium]
MARKIVLAALVAGLAGAAAAWDDGPVPEPEPIGTMSELMIKLMYPASDAILYVESRAPTNEVEWNELQAQALLLAESANLIMMPSRVVGDADEWMRDARLMFDAGAAAYEAALEQDLEALIALNEQVYMSCVVCHRRTRPDYGRNYKRFEGPPVEALPPAGEAPPAEEAGAP